MACAIEDAGFEIRDQIMWLYGTGFPKSHDVAQNIEKMHTTGKARRECRELGLTRNRFSGTVEGTLIADTGGKVPLSTEAAKKWQGYGTALKPAHEPIVLARKPLEEKTVATNVLKHGTGALNIDATRVHIDTNDHVMKYDYSSGKYQSKYKDGGTSYTYGNRVSINPSGRWPANVCWSYHDNEYELKSHITKEQKQALYEWMNENA
jgi:hypothetical protein